MTEITYPYMVIGVTNLQGIIKGDPFSMLADNETPIGYGYYKRGKRLEMYKGAFPINHNNLTDPFLYAEVTATKGSALIARDETWTVWDKTTNTNLGSFMTSSAAAIPSVSEGFVAYPKYLWNNAHEVIAKFEHLTDDHVQILVGDATVTLKIVPDAPKGAYGLETLSAPCLIEKEGELNLSDMDKQLLVLYQTIVAIMVAQGNLARFLATPKHLRDESIDVGQQMEKIDSQNELGCLILGILIAAIVYIVQLIF